MDVDDLTGSTAGGLHLATMGGLWQALTYGFAGVRASGSVLSLDPRLPAAWDALELRLRFRGSLVRARLEHGRVAVEAAKAVPVRVGGTGPVYGTHTFFDLDGNDWKVVET
jgi:trehalose/maltose hydrolase-like predicted phosphorylase